MLTSDAVVILDSLNYIKGYRYELYCLSKHVKTTHCVIHCDTPMGVASDWNAQRPLEKQYATEIFDALALRFETPDSSNRWDSPLFVLFPSDPLPESDLVDVLLHRKPPPPNQSTQSQPLSTVDFLHELDRQTQVIMTKILELQNQQLLSRGAILPGTDEPLTIGTEVTMAELRRLRRQFISYTKLHPMEDVSKIPAYFIKFLNNSM